MTIVILACVPSSSQPWGWWDDDDSLARPSPPRDSLLETEGRIRFDGRSDGMRHGRLGYDASCRSGAWQAMVAGNPDSGYAPVRQRATWSTPAATVQAGDLSAWFDSPLLEGGTRRSGIGTPLRKLGSGNGVSGLDLQARDAGLLPWRLEAHSRIAASSRGTTRSSLLAGLGAIRSGITATESGPHLALAGIRLGSDDASADASILSDGSRHGFSMAGETAAGAARHRLSARQVDRSLDHDGLPRGWAGASQAEFESRWRTSSVSFGVSGEAASDSCARRTLRLIGDISRERSGFEGRVRARWTRTDEARMRLTPGIARITGTVRPWAELPWTSGDGFTPSLGLRWMGRNLQADLATTRSVRGEWAWKMSSSLGRERSRGGSRVEIALGGGEDIEKGEGSWTTSW